MASPSIPLVNGPLGAAAFVYYTSPTGVWTQITKVLCVNTDAIAHQVTIYVVPKGSSAGTASVTTDGQAVLPLQSWPSPNEYGLILAPGDMLAASADTASVVNFFASGLQLT
jgi:hypothetical protein